MRIRLAIIIIFSLSLIKGFSQEQDGIPAPGQIDKKDLLMTECVFDKNAEAVVLFDVGKIVFKAYNAINTEYTRHIRVKILSNKGLDLANIKIIYVKGDYEEKLKIEEAQTINLDDKGNVVITKVDKKSFVDKEINKLIGEKAFAFPDVRVGSVIEYSYKITGFLPTGFREWQFQSAIPVRFSRYLVQFPPSIPIECKPFGSIPVQKHISISGSDTIRSYTMTDLPPLRPEPFMTCMDDYKQRLSIKYKTTGSAYGSQQTWGLIAVQFMLNKDLGKQLLEELPNTETMDQGLHTIPEPYNRTMYVYYYVKNNMHLKELSGLETQRGIKEAWKEKKGTNGEINLILINLLKKAGLDAMPLLVSTHNHGKIDNSNPSARQFNRLMVYIHLNDQDYVLDASDKFGSPKIFPWDIQYSKQLVIYSNGITDNQNLNIRSEIKPFYDKKAAFRQVVQIQGNIDDAGLMTGDATVTDYDYSRIQKLEALQLGKDQFTDRFFTGGNEAIRLDSSSLINENEDTLPLKQQVWFTNKLTSSGNYKYFSPNLFTGLYKSPFVAESRFSDIFFGATQNLNIVENIFIPDGYAFDALPKDSSFTSPDEAMVFSRNVNVHADMINVHFSLEFKAPTYLAIEYSDIKEFFDKCLSMLNEQIVIKKNK